MGSGIPGQSIVVACVMRVIEGGRGDFPLFPLAAAWVRVRGGDSFGRIGLHGRDVPMLIYRRCRGVFMLAGPGGSSISRSLGKEVGLQLGPRSGEFGVIVSQGEVLGT